MIIKTVAFGNWEEAFVETRLQNRVNVIFSDENNRGKTLLVQSLMYALGNTPIFLSTFDDYNHFFYVEIKTGRRFIEIIRRRSDFSVIMNDELKLFSSVSDFKHFFDANIFPLPRYRRPEGSIVADLALFFQLFFLPQDKRNTSNTINHGFTNKEDFVDMVKAFADSPNAETPRVDQEGLKAEIAEAKRRIARLQRRSQFAVQNPDIATRVQAGYSAENYACPKTETKAPKGTRISGISAQESTRCVHHASPNSSGRAYHQEFICSGAKQRPWNRARPTNGSDRGSLCSRDLTLIVRTQRLNWMVECIHLHIASRG